MAEKTSAPQAPATTVETPEPVSPKEGALVDVHAVPFEWTEVEADVEYILQIALDADFEEVIATLSAGHTTAVTVYNTLNDSADSDLHWRVRAGERGPWGPAAYFHAGSRESLAAAHAERDRAARRAAQAALQRHLEGEHRVPVVLPEEAETGPRAAILLGIIVVSFIILLIVLFLLGEITYPAEAHV